jgi:hypothetical protein
MLPVSGLQQGSSEPLVPRIKQQRRCDNLLPFVTQKVSPRPRNTNGRIERPFRKSFRDKDFFQSRGDSLCTIVNETSGLWLVHGLFPQVLYFQGDAVLQLVERGLYSKSN